MSLWRYYIFIFCRFLLEQEQESLVQWFQYQHLRKSYNRHFFFVNFTRFQKFVNPNPKLTSWPKKKFFIYLVSSATSTRQKPLSLLSPAGISRYSKQKPIYFNIVRDPVDRLVLDYYDRRNKSSSATQQEVNRRNSLRSGAGRAEVYYFIIPFFCITFFFILKIHGTFSLQLFNTLRFSSRNAHNI